MGKAWPVPARRAPSPPWTSSPRVVQDRPSLASAPLAPRRAPRSAPAASASCPHQRLIPYIAQSTVGSAVKFNAVYLTLAAPCLTIDGGAALDERCSLGVMKRAPKVVVGILVVLGLGFVALVWFAIGEHERLFGEPIEIVFPKDFTGLVCVQVSPGQPPGYVRPKRYYVSRAGLAQIELDVLQSHNPRRYFELDQTSGNEVPLSGRAYTSIFSENAPTGTAYSVGWVGTTESWDYFRRTKEAQPFCLGRHSVAAWAE